MKRRIYYVLMGMVGLTALSCNKQLDIDTIEAVPDAKFWSSERDLDGPWQVLMPYFVQHLCKAR